VKREFSCSQLTRIEREKPEEVSDLKLDFFQDQQRKSQSLNSAELQAEYRLALVFFRFEVATCLGRHPALIFNEKECVHACVHSRQ